MALSPAIMELRRRFHAIVAEREALFVKLRPLRAQQTDIRNTVAANKVDAAEAPIVEQIKAIEAELIPLQQEMAKTHRALAVLDPHPSGDPARARVGLAPDGREPEAAAA